MSDASVYVIVDTATGEPVWFTHDDVLVSACMKKTDQCIEHTEDSFLDKFNGQTLKQLYLGRDDDGEHVVRDEDVLIQALETINAVPV